MTHWSDPTERQEIWRFRKTEADRQFREREITEPVYRATLHGLGYRGQAIFSEINLVLMEAKHDQPKNHR